MTGFLSPNHTQTPNNLFDVHMRDMTEAELKVVLVIVRKTLGWHKAFDEISLSMLEELTGLSRQACIDGANRAVQRGIVEVVGQGRRGVTIYALVIKEDQSANQTSEGDERSTSKTSSGLQSRHTKEKKKKEELKKGVATPSKKKKEPDYTQHDALINAWATALELPGLSVGLTYIEEYRRAEAEKLIAKNVTPDEVMTYIRTFKTGREDYRFGYLLKDIIEYREKNIRPAPAPRPVVTLEAPITLTDDELAERRRLVEAARAERERISA